MTEKKEPAESGAGSPAALQAPLPGARAALVLLLAINLFNYIDRQILSAVVPQIREEMLASGDPPGPVVQFLLQGLERFLGSNPENALIGLLAMAFMVTYMLAAPLFSVLKLRRWWIIAGGVLLWSLASGGTGLAATFGALLLTRCLVGIGEAAYGPVAPTMIADLYPVERRGSVLAWFYLAIPVGCALGFVLGGLVAAWLGWRWAFYVVVPPGVILAIWCLTMREPRAGQADRIDETKQRKVTWRDYLVLLRTPSFVLDTLGMTAMTFAIGGIGFWVPSYIHEFRGVPNLAQVNLIFGAILVVSGLSATLLGGILADRLRSRYPGSYFLVSGFGLVAAFPFCLAIVYVPFPWAWACIFLACFGLFMGTGPTNTVLANVTHPAMRASAFALNILIIHSLGDVISPLVIGAITDACGKNMDPALILVSVLVLAGGLVWIWGARYLARDTELAPRRLDQQVN